MMNPKCGVLALLLATLLGLQAAQADDAAAAKNDRKIVFLVSTGGSSLAVFGDERQKLKSAIQELKADQQFAVVATSDGNVQSLFKSNQFSPATNAAKKQAYDFIDNLVSTGKTDLNPALDRLKLLKPDLMWLYTNCLTLGDAAENTKVIQKAREISRKSHIRINTMLAFSSEADPVEVTKNFDALYDLAKACSGICVDKDGKEISVRPK